MTTLLLDARADLSLQDLDFSNTGSGPQPHRTPLHYSAARGLAPVAAKLIEAKAALDVQDAQRQTPLHLSIDEGHDDVIDLLLSASADVNFTNTNSSTGLSLLSKAVHDDDSSFVQKLLRARADINFAGKQDMTALHLAVRKGNTAMARLLLGANANPLLKCKFGTAGDMAAKKGAKELAALLTEAAETKENPAPVTVMEKTTKYDPPSRMNTQRRFFVNGRLVSMEQCDM